MSVKYDEILGAIREYDGGLDAYELAVQDAGFTGNRLDYIKSQAGFRRSVLITDTPTTQELLQPCFFIASQAGTYPNFGNQTSLGQFCMFTWSGSVWSKFETSIDLSNYYTKTNIDKRAITQTSYFSNNRFFRDLNTLSYLATLDNSQENMTFYPNSFSATYVDALPIFGYSGKSLQVVFGSQDQISLQIPVSNFINDELYVIDNVVNANFEIYSPVVAGINFTFYQITGTTWTQITTKVVNLVIGVNKINISGIVPNTASYISFKSFKRDTNLVGQTIKYGRINVFGGINTNSLDSLDITSVRKEISINDSSKNKVQSNYWRSNKYADDLSLIKDNSFCAGKESFSIFSPTAITFVDASQLFGYYGRCMRVDTATVTNFVFYLPASNFIYDELYKIKNQFYCNLEFNSPISTSFQFAIYSSISGVIAEKYNSGTKTVIIGKNTINAGVVLPSMASGDFLFLRFFPTISSDWNNKTFYFGRINCFSGDPSTSLDYANNYNTITESFIKTTIDTYRQPYWFGKKVVDFGDSIVSQKFCLPELIRRVGLIYVEDEIDHGVNGHSQTGVGGSKITPLLTGSQGGLPGQSIYFRADDIHFYNPDIILLRGGQNDASNNIGTINDTPYTGPEVSSNPPTFFAAYVGTLVKLITQNPLAVIICVAPGWSADQTPAQKMLKVNAIRDCAEKYGCRFINLYTDCGINAINQASFIQDGVHPNALGGGLIGTLISNYLQ